MTTEEHLTKIRAKCEQLLESPSCDKPAKAGWSATISICDELIRILTTQPWESEAFQWADPYAFEILAAWPEELL